MLRLLCKVMFFALLASGCANKPAPKSVASDAFFPVHYQGWSCQQLAEEADMLEDALAVSSENPAQAHSTDAIARQQRAIELVRNASNLKGCKIEQRP
jgi:hypothetical protein